MALRLYGDGNIENVTSINTAVSSTELGYLDGVTSDVQSQLNKNSLILIHSETVTSATNPINIDNVFSDEFQNYKIMINLSTPSYLIFRGRSSGSTYSSSTHRWIIRYYNTVGTGFVESNGTGTALKATFTGATTALMEVNVFSPYESEDTFFSWQGGAHGTNQHVIVGSGDMGAGVTNQFDGIELSSTSGMTGTVRIYGYRNS